MSDQPLNRVPFGAVWEAAALNHRFLIGPSQPLSLHRVEATRNIATVLPTQDVLLVQGLHINNRGQILGVGGIHHELTHDREAHIDEGHAGPMHVFLLTPVNSPH